MPDGPIQGERKVSVSRVIATDPATIFAVLTDPSQHRLIDGSDTVREAKGDTERLTLGSKFSMGMRMGVPYRIKNEVVEFEQDHLIAWQHIGHHRWRYQLEPVEGGTRVTETFDWSTSRLPRAIELAGYPSKHPAGMEKTLERLDALVVPPPVPPD